MIDVRQIIESQVIHVWLLNECVPQNLKGCGVSIYIKIMWDSPSSWIIIIYLCVEDLIIYVVLCQGEK